MMKEPYTSLRTAITRHFHSLTLLLSHLGKEIIKSEKGPNLAQKKFINEMYVRPFESMGKKGNYFWLN